MSLDEYYRRLKLPDTASPADVKRAYRRLRAKYHPDRNKGRESTVEPVFKRIQEAFEILTGERQPPVLSQAAASTERRDKPAHSREHRSSPPMRGANCLVELFVPLEAAIHGGEVEASYAVRGPCHPCQERGAQCASCNGSGLSVSGMHCVACGGTGRPPASDRCQACLGTGIRTWRKFETVKVPAGVWDGQRLVVEGGGHPGTNGGPSGDAIFSVAIVCSAAFRRDGLNLASEIQVDFVTATLGGNFDAQILGRAHRMTIPPNAQQGSTIRLRGHGLTDRNGFRGDLTLQLVLAMPAAASHLTDDERQRLREMFADAGRRATQVMPACSSQRFAAK
ncbi:DnaJ domain-containing protein [Paraburkholderia sp. SEWSISQ10-3 4]|uniref:DnaJ C-terminal domain-containing protein n=1 Tax=Paraburkholderia TaxID=1822464 RepID=UPI00225765B2|nr:MULTISPECIES: DnaJ C-terminal domain-containing protein [Paraburkholderia]MCX4136847.1 DnaJ domain-containing protein [Paraburkholderia aspalathi]MDN7169539.1 DnaJ domain-containing protein [Paraburkholderia sp. SEWSISQ10-3 4]MDQ6499178.1 DnaJ domain-containing protein [Paraburkholderia aspalathi]